MSAPTRLEMACWYGCWPFPWKSGRWIFWRAVYILAAALSVASYFISYRHPPITPPVVSPFAQLPAFLRFILVWIGSLFSVDAPAICGAVVLFLFGGLP